jgi:predicted  nucleic acid-binding Zn-ribbon protein
LTDKSKYDYFMDELLSLEKQIYTVIQKSDELVDENNDLREEIENLQAENGALKNKLREIETSLTNHMSESSDLFSDNISKNEREEIKEKIENLISRLDYHLRS